MVVGAAAAVYFRFLRPWHLHWGATPEEASGEVAGDELIPEPDIVSYAGTLTLTAITDPGHFPDPGTLTGALRGELDQIIGHPAVQPWP